MLQLRGLTSQICILSPLAKIKFSRKFVNLQYCIYQSRDLTRAYGRTKRQYRLKRINRRLRITVIKCTRVSLAGCSNTPVTNKTKPFYKCIERGLGIKLYDIFD